MSDNEKRYWLNRLTKCKEGMVKTRTSVKDQWLEFNINECQKYIDCIQKA